ncbi:hypothetical protein ACTFIR_008310 [Dictyostelium discoideum]
MGDFNSNEDNNNNPFNNVLYNPYIVDLYDSTNNNNNNNNIIGGFNCDSSIFTQQITNTNNELTIPLTQSIQNLLPPVQQQPQLFITPNNNSNNNNNDINTSIDINLNQLVYSTPSQQITNSVQPIYQCVTQSTTSNIDTNINTINDNNNNNNNNNNNSNNNNSVNNNNNLLSMCQDPTLILQIQQLLLQQQLLQQAQQQSVPLNIQVPTTTTTTPINQQHQALLVPQQKQFYGNVSDNSSPETNFSYASPSSPSSTQSQSSPYEQQPLSPNPTISLSSSISVTASTTTTTKPSTTEKTKESSLKSKSKSNEKEKEDEEDDDDDDDRPKKRKKFDKNVYKGVDLGDDLLEITSEEFQAYKNNFFANASDKKTVSALNYQFRKIKNRESARRSRERKATHVDELEAKIAEIEKERDNYKKENERLRMELDQYKLQEKQKSAGSIFDYISIGSPTTQNFSKNFGIILFLFLFGSFILTNTTPNFFNTNNGVINPNLVYNANSNINNNNNNNNVNRFSVNGVHSTQQYFQSQRNPLSNLDEDSLESLTASQGVFSTHFVPEQPSILLNRESIRNWATLPQNSVASLSFEKDNALKTIENANLDKSKHNVISNLNQLQQQQQPSSDELMIDQKEEKNCNNNNNENNNDNDNNKNSDDEKGKEIEEIKRKSSTTTISPTRYVNNSTISLLINPTSVIGDIPDDLMKNSNVTTFGENSSFKFNFLIDTQNFPNGSNDISKAFFDNENQQMTVTSVIIAIQKSPKTPTQQPSTK